MSKIKVMIIDDNEVIGILIGQILSAEKDIEFLGHAKTAKEGQALIEQKPPDVVLIDISLDDSEGGLSVLKNLAAQFAPVKFIVVSSYDEDRYAESAILKGACGFLSKEYAVSQLSDAIRTVMAGGYFISGALGPAMIERIKKDHSL